jgi:hypothetical protein
MSMICVTFIVCVNKHDLSINVGINIERQHIQQDENDEFFQVVPIIWLLIIYTLMDDGGSICYLQCYQPLILMLLVRNAHKY